MPDFAVTSRATLFEDEFLPALSPHAHYDVSPDGRRLLVIKGVNEQRLVVVHTWEVELRERLRRAAEQR